MTNSIRFAVIGLIGALMVPSLCSAQLIILHENWHGLGASKEPSTAARRGQQRSVVKQQDQRLSRAPRTTSRATERRQTPLGRADSGHPPVRVAEHRFHTSEMVESSQHSQVAAAADIALTPTIPYDVIESPFRQPYREDTLHVRSKYHPPITLREGPRTERAVIPNTMQMPVWKTPFSYGYFGTSGTKHWYGHHGYRDRRTVWSYR
ncbi:MAG: hypothetical protein GY924_16380 [Planctomycetaceae bacterium]|nr:hypothetical protein [Planctomycetaceae bacterium]